MFHVKHRCRNARSRRIGHSAGLRSECAHESLLPRFGHRLPTAKHPSVTAVLGQTHVQRKEELLSHGSDLARESPGGPQDLFHVKPERTSLACPSVGARLRNVHPALGAHPTKSAEGSDLDEHREGPRSGKKPFARGHHIPQPGFTRQCKYGDEDTSACISSCPSKLRIRNGDTGQRPGAGGQKPAPTGQRPEGNDQKATARRQRPEGSGQGSRGMVSREPWRAGRGWSPRARHRRGSRPARRSAGTCGWTSVRR